MTITLEPPEVINRLDRSGFKHAKKFVLLVFRSEKLDDEQLKEVLTDVLPIGESGADRAIEEIKRNSKSVVYRGVKVIIEHYLEQLKDKQVNALMKSE